jgi:dCMP deaminase
MQKRITKDEYYLNIAKAVSARSTCLKRQYGCVIVNNDEIIATGYNGSPRGEMNCCDMEICNRMNEPNNSGKYDECHSVHAEQNAIISASRKEMLGATVYLYGEEIQDIKITESSNYVQKAKIEIEAKPCPICRRMLKNAGIKYFCNREGNYVLDSDSLL